MRMAFYLAGAAMMLPRTAIWSQAASPSATAKRKELQQIQRQLEQKKQEIQQYRRQSDILRRDLSHLAGERSEWRGRIGRLERKILQAESEKNQLKAKIGALELAQDRWHAVLAQEMNGYLSQNLLEFDYYGNADLWEEPFRRAAIVEKVRYVRDLSGFKLNVQKAAEAASQRKMQLQTKTAAAEAERVSRESLYHRKQEAYLEARQKAEQAMKDAQELRESASALTQLVKALERKSRGKSRGRAPTLFAEAPHSLPWPVEGRVISLFGRQYVRELHTWVIHQGIQVATGSGSSVHPVQKGKVIFAGPFRSYGKVIIVDHGQDFYTIYGKLGQMLKAPGDKVNVSDALGTAEPVGSAGILYFEIRQNVEALDPLAWLRRK